MAPSSTTSSSNINSKGTTNNNNEINEDANSTSNNDGINEDTNSTSNNDGINEDMNSSSSNNDVNEGLDSYKARPRDHVRVFVAYNGKWKWDGKEWLFENSKGSLMVVSKYVTLSQITDILNTKFNVDQDSCGLKLEVHYRFGSPWFPIIEIEDDHDISAFISESSKTKLPLCVTPVLKDDVAEGVGQDEINPDIKEESPHGRKDDSVERSLMEAIMDDDWVKAREIVNTEEITWTSKLDGASLTAVHLAVGEYKDIEAAKDILMEINPELLVTMVDNDGLIPAHYAALYGNTECLEIMVHYNPECLFILNDDDSLPIHYTFAIPSIDTFLYLFKQMKSDKYKYDKFFGSASGHKLLRYVIDEGLMDVAYELIKDYPSMATPVYEKAETPLEWIIRKPDLFHSGTHYNFCQRFVYHHVPIENISFGSNDTADVENQETPKKDTKYVRRCLHDVISWVYVKLWETTLLHVPHVKRLKDDKVKHNTTIKLLRRICEELVQTNTTDLYDIPFCLAVENDTAEAIEVLTKYFDRSYEFTKNGQDMYELTVLNRSEKVYSFIMHRKPYAKLTFKLTLDDDLNNILHLAGRLAPIHKLNIASGAALQMQRELQWFEEVKKVVQLTQTQELNCNKETPMMVFRREHKDLRKDGEEWMKKTADSYTITAALIITIVFAAAITVPGGNDDKTGKPIYETKASLIIFAISDAISLFTSTTSLLLFLSILTARYADEDFLYKLPKRLIYGLVMLFVSVTSMMVAFSATLYIMFGQGKAWILIPIAALTCLPIASFVTLQFPLLVELISSTYCHGIFGKKKHYRQSGANANRKKRS
ncbi:ankyrin repeat family protein [Artemisia annua]|uniref:Ankyrin repeat family protein n=1 Tax=Artemisia annua TaxID=35608 RepID=A0A2U1PBX5_ARTAN|nr:ankyrin repeat family protein [Artemisia annua]